MSDECSKQNPDTDAIKDLLAAGDDPNAARRDRELILASRLGATKQVYEPNGINLVRHVCWF